MSNPPQMLVGRLASCDELESAKTRYLEPIKDQLDGYLGTGLGGHAWALVSGLVVQARREATELRTRSEILETERIEQKKADATLDADTAEVRKVLIPLRRLFEGAFGSEYVREIGFEGPTPDDPTAVHVLATYVRKRVEVVARPEDAFAGAGFDPVSHARHLDAPLARLTGSVRRSTEERREADVALGRKNEAVAAYDRSFSLAANMVSMLLDASGERELARKVRPSRSRPGNTVSVASGEPEPALPAPPPQPDAEADADAPVVEPVPASG